MFCDHLFFLVFQDVNSCPVLPSPAAGAASLGVLWRLGLFGTRGGCAGGCGVQIRTCFHLFYIRYSMFVSGKKH